MERIFSRFAALVARDEPLVFATVIERGGDGAAKELPALGATLLVSPSTGVTGSLGNDLLDAVVARDATAALASGRSVARHYGAAGEARRDELTVFLDVFAPAPRMIIFGAVDFTGALVKVAKILGFHVTVCDARPIFATARRFPDADQVVVAWPQVYLEEVAHTLSERDAVCVLTHDHKFDVPAIVAALATPIGYLGAMGSRRTHAERIERLIEAGVDPARFQEIMAPIGLAIGARSPEETAVAICAEIVARRAGVPAHSLRDATGPLHQSEN